MKDRIQSLGRVSCIINPGAARSKWERQKELKDFLQKNLPGEKYDVAGGKEETIKLTQELCGRSDTIIVLGGDGTIADVMHGIREAGAERRVALGIVPMGSGNAYRKSLGIPLNVKKAVKHLHKGTPREIDVMEIVGKTAGFASIGATAMVTFDKYKEKIHGPLAYIWAGRTLLSLPRWRVEVELKDGLEDDGHTFDRKVLSLEILDCVVAKSNYFGYNFRVAPQASLDDGYLDITFYEMSGPGYAAALPLFYLGLYQHTQRHFKAKRMILEGKNLPFEYHGECLQNLDRIEARVLPRALRVICPQTRRDKKSLISSRPDQAGRDNNGAPTALF